VEIVQACSWKGATKFI